PDLTPFIVSWASWLLAIDILVFPMYLFTVMYKEQRASKKRELFGNLQEFAGPSQNLSLLGVGCGTRANFKFYLPGYRVTCIDPNPNFEKFLTKSIAENRHLQFERFVVAAGENMHQVADGSVDMLVCTLVLCSVENQEQSLCEVCVLSWMEHQAASGHLWAQAQLTLRANLDKSFYSFVYSLFIQQTFREILRVLTMCSNSFPGVGKLVSEGLNELCKDTWFTQTTDTQLN
uniref:Methyltransferase type 11 domain-containing protein n=1 Tax=Piliocolobus tephrosceles TaxID=591936 RepID=A0A8C9IUY4_9PRIM